MLACGLSAGSIAPMYCQFCGVEAPTRKVVFYQNIGALVMRFSREIKGKSCKRCMIKYFLQYTLITMAVGWLGIISAIVSPFFVLNNLFYFLKNIRMERVPDGARVPTLSDAEADKIHSQLQRIID